MQNQIRPTDTVVYWGSYCSAWTHFARSAHGRLRIFETEGEASVADTLRKRNIRHVRLLVLEDDDIRRKFLNSAADVLTEVRLDMVLFRFGAEAPENAVSLEFSGVGYTVFRLRDHGFEQLISGGSKGPGSYVALRHDLPMAVQSRIASPSNFNARNLSVKLSRWLQR